MSNLNFSVTYGNYNSINSNYHLHCHDNYEIYMFIEGDSNYVVEEKIYHLNPDDIIIIRKNDMHRVWHNSNAKYSRLTITVSPNFFTENNCTEYEKAFLNTKSENGNKIVSETVHEVGLYDAIMRFRDFTKGFSELNTPIAKSLLIEILYCINIVHDYEQPDEAQKPINKIINYLNSHYTDDLTLDFLCEHFFISKYHLCRTFKKRTGLTIQTYIKEKRLAHFNELIKSEKNLTQAALLSGFNDYSVFYRTYTKKYGHSPERKRKKEL